MTVTRWWWIRHAPVTETDGRIYGATDPNATIEKPEAYRALDAMLPEDAVWVTSHLKRTKQTAAAIAEAGGRRIAPLEEPDLGEQSFGAWHGLTYDEVNAFADSHRFWLAPATHRPPDGESFADRTGLGQGRAVRVVSAPRGGPRRDRTRSRDDERTLERRPNNRRPDGRFRPRCGRVRSRCPARTGCDARGRGNTREQRVGGASGRRGGGTVGTFGAGGVGAGARGGKCRPDGATAGGRHRNGFAAWAPPDLAGRGFAGAGDGARRNDGDGRAAAARAPAHRAG